MDNAANRADSSTAVPVMTLDREIALLFLLPLPIACITWTVTHEEVFREPRDWCAARSKASPRWYARKFFYLFTCEYCFSHYVAAFFLLITRYTLLFDDWRGYLIAGFSLVWIANVYMGLFARLRLEIREDRLDVAAAELREGGVGLILADAAPPITPPLKASRS